MEDLINRQAAIDAVRSYMAENWVIDSDWHADGIAYDIRRLPSAQPEPHWIPCTERVPEKVSDDKCEVVLVFDDDRKSVELGAYNDGQWIGLMSRSRINVVAWYPLPRLKPWEEKE